jgi:hypothetical protein
MEEAGLQRLGADRRSFVRGRADRLLSGGGIRRTRQYVRCRHQGRDLLLEGTPVCVLYWAGLFCECA